MTRAVYNEIAAYPSAWLRNLIAAGHVAPGRVDERPVQEVRASDLVGAAQFHAFAGIGCWSYALRLAGWADARPVWTVSCPCQPFSTAGLRRGAADDRHLWPVYFELVRECRPPVILGEQVSSPDGRTWFDAVSADLEGAGYAVGALNTCAAGVGAPHIRQRLYFVALADADRAGPQGWGERHGADERTARPGGVDGGLPDATRRGRGQGRLSRDGAEGQGPGSADGGWLGDADRDSSWRDGRAVPGEKGEDAGVQRGADRPWPAGQDVDADRSGRIFGAWDDAEWIACSDGKSRPAQPGVRPLAPRAAPGVGRVRSNRVGRLKGYGNGLNAIQAATFIRAVMESTARAA